MLVVLGISSQDYIFLLPLPVTSCMSLSRVLAYPFHATAVEYSTHYFFNLRYRNCFSYVTVAVYGCLLPSSVTFI